MATTNNTSSNGNSNNKVPLQATPMCIHHDKAYERMVTAIRDQVPLLAHGSGDVLPHQVDSQVCDWVARLTTDYITQLCMAAVDTHDLWTDGAGGIFPPPPPPLKRKWQPKAEQQQQVADLEAARAATPLLPCQQVMTTTTTTTTTGGRNNTAMNTKNSTNKRIRSVTEDYWDLPLPEPKIRKTNNYTTLQKQQSFSKTSKTMDETKKSTSFSDWTGCVGVDLCRSVKRSRQELYGITAHCFRFPICHDAALYGRIRDLRTAQQDLQSLLIDSTVMDCIQQEAKALQTAFVGKAQQASLKDADDEDDENNNNNNNSNNNNSSGSNNNSNSNGNNNNQDGDDGANNNNNSGNNNDEDENQDDDDDEPEEVEWPCGMNDLLPTFRLHSSSR